MNNILHLTVILVLTNQTAIYYSVMPKLFQLVDTEPLTVAPHYGYNPIHCIGQRVFVRIVWFH